MNIITTHPIWLLSLIFLNSIIYSQDSTTSTEDSTLRIGIQIGGNLSSLSGGSFDKMESDYKFGLNFGLYWNYALSHRSDLHIELRRIVKGMNWNCPMWGNCKANYITYSITYWELPVYYSLKLVPLPNKKKFLNLQLGLFLSYASSASVKEVYEAPSDWKTPNHRKILENDYNKFDYGISFAIQLFATNKGENFYVRLIYDLSLAPVFKSGSTITHDLMSNRKMRSIVLFFGYEFY